MYKKLKDGGHNKVNAHSIGPTYIHMVMELRFPQVVAAFFLHVQNDSFFENDADPCD